ncbi:putative lipase [Podosphaera aphanis]|nr:putative lipase [Podosphaera aphanis]
MIHSPFVARLNGAEYLALIGSFILVGLEAVLRILTIALPYSVLHIFYRASRRIFNIFASSSPRIDSRKLSPSTLVQDASDFLDLCALFGYYVEEHVVQTEDGYVLGVHRLAWKRGEQGEQVNHGKYGIKKGVIYMHHGLLMNSEVWVCLTEAERCLPFMLVERGYDVWLGNNRGNKYSKKSIFHSPNDIPFWNFSMDQFAFYDIPDTIQYILQTTSAASLSYIGFSQGTAQAFASLAIHPKLNDQVNVFIALAPAISPAGLSNSIVDVLIKASPQVIFLLFGRRSLLSSTTMWQSILYPPIFCRFIDMALSFLFGWTVQNITDSQKLAAYPHLYSFTSTKSVVHWFQIIRKKCFQMYDDDQSHFTSLKGLSKTHTKVPKFPTRNIKSPIVLLFGGSDSLVDIDVMLKELPTHTIAIEIPHYEHLDFLWARDVDKLVFPHVFDALETFCCPEYSQTKDDSQSIGRASFNGAEKPVLSDAASDNEGTLPGTNSSNSSQLALNAEILTRRNEKKLITPFQSSIPRPCNSAQKRSKDRPPVNVGETVSCILTPRLQVEGSPSIEPMALMTPTGSKDGRISSVGSHENFSERRLGTGTGKTMHYSIFSKDLETKVSTSSSCPNERCVLANEKKIGRRATKLGVENRR